MGCRPLALKDLASGTTQALPLSVLTIADLAANASLAASDYYMHGEITVAAMALDRAMSERGFRGWVRRWRYRRVWGVAWQPLLTAAVASLDFAPQLAVGTPRHARSLTHTAAL